MSPEEEGGRGGGSPPAAGAVLHQVQYPLTASPASGAEPCSRDAISTPISAADTTTNISDSVILTTHLQESISPNPSPVTGDDVEKFDGKIVYNPDGSAYIIEGESELSDDDSLPDGCIVDGRGMSIPHSLVFPQIASAYYVSRLYAHQLYQHQQRSSITPPSHELPVMHSYRVISYRSSKSSSRSSPSLSTPTMSVASVPVKPILMCFICKLSFSYSKSFIAHAQSEHQLTLLEDEKQILSHSTASAIIQVVGKNKQPTVSFLEPVSTSTCSQESIEQISSQRSHNGEESNLREASKKTSIKSNSSNTVSSSLSLLQKPVISTSPVITSTSQNSLYNHHNQWISTQVSSSSWSKANESCTNSFSSISTPIKVPQTSFANLSQQPPNFLSGTTIGVCPEHIQGRPSGADCSKCELILTNSRLSTSGTLTGIHSRNSCKTLKCPKCNWHYKYQETLEIHMKEKHPDSDTSCIYCIAGQPHPRLARGETYTCGYKPYRCEVCNYSTTTKGNLSIHMQSDKHLNNMQELQHNNNNNNNNNSNTNNPSSTQDSPILTRSPHQQQNQNSLINSQSSQGKSKPTFRCDACNYETNVARNLRIHMTSEKHTHHMLVLQQNIKTIQTLSVLQSHHQQAPQNQIHQHGLNSHQLEQFLQLGNLEKPQHAEAALADMAYNQALIIQMMTGGQLPAHLSNEIISGMANINVLSNIGTDIGLTPESMEPPPEPSDPDPCHLYQCCVCNNFSTDSIEGLGIHLTSDRTKIREGEILSNIAGHFICKLCSYKTNLKANFQLHCKTDKHLQRLQHVNHVKEGGSRNEWKLKYLASPSSSAQIRCHACDYYTNSVHKLALHAASPRHEAAALLLRHLLEASTNISSASKLYYCALCGFSAKNRLPLLQHVRSIKHLQMEQLHQLHRRTGIQGTDVPQTDIGDVFQVISDPNASNTQKLKPSLSPPSTSIRDRRDEESDCGPEIKQEVEQEPDHDQEIETEEFICSFCSFQSSSNEELQNHIHMTHINDNNENVDHLKITSSLNLLCPLCQDCFQNRAALEKHVMQIHSVNSDGLQRLLLLVDQSHWLNNNRTSVTSRSPDILFKKNQDEESIEQIVSDDGEETTKCNICSRLCRSLEELQQHQREIHPTSVLTLAVSEKHVYKYRCGQCSLAFKTLDKLQQHSQYHIIRDATKCAICCRSFRSVQALQRHLESAHSELQEDELAQYKKSLINSHPLLQALTEEAFRRQGIISNEQFDDEGKVDDEDNEYQDLSPLHKEQRLLEDYLNSQSIAEDSYNDPGRKFKCHRCKVAFTKQSYLTGHNKTLLHRKGEKMPYPMEKYLDPNRPYKCDVCKESFTQKNILLVHYNSVSHLHKLKRAMQEQGNNNSMITATSPTSPTSINDNQEQDKKPYKCNICKVAYSQGTTLDIHKRSVLHQTRASKIHDLAISGQLDLSRPLIEQPVLSPNNLSLTNSSDINTHITCVKCNALFNTQDQLLIHQQLYCIFSNPLTIFQQLAASQQISVTSSKTPPPSVSSSVTQEKQMDQPHSQTSSPSQDVSFPPKHKTSQMYKHLLESFGFDLVMQFNENHQRRHKKDDFSAAYHVKQGNENEDLHRNNFCNQEKEQEIEYLEEVIPEIKKSTCQHCNKDFSSVWVLKAHCEEVHRDLVPREFLEKYAQQFKCEYEKKIVIVTAATSSSTTTAPVTTTPTSFQLQENILENKEKDDFENKELISKTPEATSTTPTTTPALSNTPVSSTDSITPTTQISVHQTFTQQEQQEQSQTEQQHQYHHQQQQQQVQMTLAQHMTEMQAAFNAMAATQLHQYPSLMMSMMGLPLGINVPALAAMNLQPPLVPVMLPPPNFDNKNTFAPMSTQPDLLVKQHLVLQQQQQQQQALAANVAASQKRARTRITDDQLKILRAHFDINNSPGEDQILDMAAQSGLPPKVIKHWFRNTLFKERQRNKDSPYNFNNPPSTTLNLEEYEKTGEAKVLPLDSITNTDSVATKNEEKQSAASNASGTVTIHAHEDIKQEYNDQNVIQHSNDDFHSSVSFVEEQSRPQSPVTSTVLTNSNQDMSSNSSLSTVTQTPVMLPPPKLMSQNFNTTNTQIPCASSNNLSPLSLSNQSCSSPTKNSDFTFNCGNNGNNSGNSGKRANRTRFTDYQIKVLQEFFENNAYPKDDDLEYLSKLLGLSPRVIVVWFQNARQKARKVYENQPSLEPVSSGRESDDGIGRFQKTPSLNYQCKKCLLVFQRYYELIRHQKTHCFKEEDAKRSAQAQAAAAQVAAVLSSEDSNSSSTTTHTLQCSSNNLQALSEQCTNTNSSSIQQQTNQQIHSNQHCSQLETKNENFQCDKCNLVFERFELWREHQLVHIMNPTLFPPNYPPDSAFGILQQQALNNSSSSSDISPSLLSIVSERKRKYDDFEEGNSLDNKSSLEQNEQPKDKRLRTTILPEQLDYLYQKYQIESNPSRKMLETIAREVGLKKRVVQVWFQNTRARERKGQFRAHSQVINKRCPFCPALFKVKSALESHLNSKHADQISRGEVNIDNIPDEELSLESSPSNSSTPNIIPPLFPPINTDVEASLKKYYEESMKRYITELQAHANNGKQEVNCSYNKSFADSPLDLSKPVDLSKSVKITVNNLITLADDHNQSLRGGNDCNSFVDLSEKSIGDDDSLSETTEFLDDESSPTSPASSSQSSRQGLNTNSTGSNLIACGSSNTTIQPGGKRYRTQMSTTQVKVMKSLFSDYKTPTMAECEMLGREIGLPKRVVQVWFQNARAKEKKARLAAGLSAEGAIVHRGLTGPEECKLCSIRYSSKSPLQEHVFSRGHIELVRLAVEDGSLIPPTPGAPILRESAIASSTNNNQQGNQSQTEENLMYGSLFLHPTAMFQSQQQQQHTVNVTTSTTTTVAGECLADLLDS